MKCKFFINKFLRKKTESNNSYKIQKKFRAVLNLKIKQTNAYVIYS